MGRIDVATVSDSLIGHHQEICQKLAEQSQSIFNDIDKASEYLIASINWIEAIKRLAKE
jgi:hypothetical protein